MGGEGWWAGGGRQAGLLKRLQAQGLGRGRRSSWKWNEAERMTSESCSEVKFSPYTFLCSAVSVEKQSINQPSIMGPLGFYRSGKVVTWYSFSMLLSETALLEFNT